MIAPLLSALGGACAQRLACVLRREARADCAMRLGRSMRDQAAACFAGRLRWRPWLPMTARPCAAFGRASLAWTAMRIGGLPLRRRAASRYNHTL